MVEVFIIMCGVWEIDLLRRFAELVRFPTQVWEQWFFTAVYGTQLLNFKSRKNLK